MAAEAAGPLRRPVELECQPTAWTEIGSGRPRRGCCPTLREWALRQPITHCGKASGLAVPPTASILSLASPIHLWPPSTRKEGRSVGETAAEVAEELEDGEEDGAEDVEMTDASAVPNTRSSLSLEDEPVAAASSADDDWNPLPIAS